MERRGLQVTEDLSLPPHGRDELQRGPSLQVEPHTPVVRSGMHALYGQQSIDQLHQGLDVRLRYGLLCANRPMPHGVRETRVHDKGAV